MGFFQVKGCIGTKFIGRWSDIAVNIALDAVNTVLIEDNGRTEVDIKRYAKVEKIPGGSVEESQILRGVMVNKAVTHPKMKRYIQVGLLQSDTDIFYLRQLSLFVKRRKRIW